MKKNSFIFIIAIALIVIIWLSCSQEAVRTDESGTPTIPSYEVTFNKNGVDVSGDMDVQVIKKDNSADLTICSFTKTGYTFAGWATTADGEVAYTDGASYTMGSAAVTLYAKWTINQYAVSFDNDGGSTVSSQNVNYNGKATRPANPTKSGYTFDNWYTSDTYVTVYDFDTVVTGNITLYAKWSYTISYTLNGGTATNPTSYTVESENITLNNPTKDGYAFVGWSGTDLTGTNNTTVTITKGSTGNRSYTANWSSAISYTISYTLDGGTNDAGNPATYTIETSTITLADATRTGYAFGGWYDNSGMTGSAVTEITLGSTGDVELWAKWTIAYGTVESLSVINNREIIALPEDASNDEYTQATSTSAGFVHNISAFSIGKYEVTYELWYTVYQWAISNGYTFANAGIEGNDGTAGAAPTAAKYEPVTMVNWRDTIVWCNAYSEMSGLTPVYCTNSGFTTYLKTSTNAGSVNTTAGSEDNPFVNWTANGYRLPTEGEWQYAASCGGVYPYDYASGADANYNATTGGIDIDGDSDVEYSGDVAWYSSNSSSKTHDVGTKSANLWGVYDMSGNVFEWCWDLYNSSLPSTAQTDYRGPESGSSRVARSGSWGSWDYDASTLQIGNHDYGGTPDAESTNFGFRVARSQ